MPSFLDNETFAKELLVNYPLDTALRWIRTNLSVEDVFPSSVLDEYGKEWAKANDMVDVSLLDAARDTIADLREELAELTKEREKQS